ncbi:MAG: hypothetical protein BLM47_04365 [Candidatus Reconcilbacillus cellulovorans]|uniref:Sporulation protein n=1 Tax=Candidatus Reconcilbacillus cellulovorans TaxID=1906605 RepID=A0A2A6E205_9BACL|nr:MAG: hypothetical protein BLM47_04365 [Candidatus Reconcilbacillus cellulovorans]
MRRRYAKAMLAATVAMAASACTEHSGGVSPETWTLRRNADMRRVYDSESHANTRLFHSPEAARKVAEEREVRMANVVVTDRNAYVAVVLERGFPHADFGRLSERIAEDVRTVHPHVRNVYASADRAFVRRINAYSRELSLGVPPESLLPSFNDLVTRAFPVGPLETPLADRPEIRFRTGE